MACPTARRGRRSRAPVKPVAGALVSVAVTAALALPAPAQAKCAPLSQSQALKVSDVVFEGVVGGQIGEGAEAKVTPGKPPQAGLRFRDFRFRVARYLRGSGNDNVAVRRIAIPEGFPRRDPRSGEAWRVFAQRDSAGRLRFSPCVPYTAQLSGAAEQRVWRRLADSAGSAGSDDDGVPLPLLIGIGAVAAAAVFGAARLRRRS